MLKGELKRLSEWINNELSAIAVTLPILVKKPASFSCGYETGYKQALLDVEREFCDDADRYI